MKKEASKKKDVKAAEVKSKEEPAKESKKPVKSEAKKSSGGRVKTGISGFDKLVEGGIPEGFTTLVIGTPGTGKTLLTLEYLYNGAAKFNEKCMYVTLEQSLDDIRNQSKKIGMDLEPLEKKGLLTLMHVPSKDLDIKTIDTIKSEIKKRKAKRLVIDSLSTLSVNAPVYSPIRDVALRDIMNYKAFFSPPVLGDFVVKRFIYNFLSELKDLDCTTLVTSEAPESGDYLSRDTISEFICDGVLLLKFELEAWRSSRTLLVRKMRGTAEDATIHTFEITGKGIIVGNVKD